MAFKHCEMGHLMTQRAIHLGSVEILAFGHIHESEALDCAWLVSQGWPDPSDAVALLGP